MKAWIKIWCVSVCLLWVAWAQAASAPTHPAQQQLQQNVDSVLSVARNKQLSETQKITQIERYADRYLDYERIAALAVGLPWRQFSPQQKQDFIAAFKTMMIRLYAHAALVGAADARVVVLPKLVNQGSNRVDTFTTVTSKSGKQYEVAYQMYLVGGVYKVYNFRVEGTSLVTVYRNQFADLIKQHGIDGTIKILRQKGLNKVEKLS